MCDRYGDLRTRQMAGGHCVSGVATHRLGRTPSLSVRRVGIVSDLEWCRVGEGLVVERAVSGMWMNASTADYRCLISCAQSSVSV